MNSRIYLFGQLGKGYTQYPTDYTQSCFQDFERNARAKTAICVQREGDLMLYQYIRRLSNTKSEHGEYIGIAVVYNGVLLTDIMSLFHICEDVITNMVVSGEILEFTDDGGIISNVDKLYQVDAEFTRISEYLSVQLNTLSAKFEKMPPVNYALGKEQSKSFSIDDDMASIIEATRNYAKVYVLKELNYNSASLSSYTAKLFTLNQTKENALQKVKKQQEEITSLKRKQKNMTLVLILIIIISCGGVGILFYVSSTNNQIQCLQEDISNLQNTVDSCKQNILSQRDSINELAATNYQQSLDISTLNTENERLISEKTQLSEDLEKSQKQLNIANTKVEQLTKETKEQKGTIDTLRTRLSKYSSNSNTSSSYNNNLVGANISNSTSGYDKNYALWLRATKPLKINSFYIKSNKSGYITIGLYNSSNTLIAKYEKYVKNEDITKVTPSFNIPKAGDYYLAIEKHNGIGLSYHKSSATEYSRYQNGDLQLIGSSRKGERSYAAKDSYYRYFYYISYSPLLLMR